MSCAVEIIVAEIVDTTYMPLQAAFTQGGQTICFVDGQAVEVKLGQSNEKWIEVISGVNPGTMVALSPPADFLFSNKNESKSNDTGEGKRREESDAAPSGD
jgi:hypothetical protein